MGKEFFGVRSACLRGATALPFMPCVFSRAIDAALTRCMEAHPPEGLERRMHPDANTMAGLWAQMLVDRVDTVPRAGINPDVMAALERWRASE